MSAELIASSWLGDATGSLELAAAVAVAAAKGSGHEGAGSLLIELGERGPSRPTLLASPQAREIEQALGELGAQAAARGRICHLRLPADGEGRGLASAALAALPEPALCVLHGPPDSLRAQLDLRDLLPQGALLRANLERDRSLAALAAADLNSRGIRVRIAKHPLGWLAGRLALAGLQSADAGPRSTGQLLSGLRGGRRERTNRSSESASEDDHIMLGSFYGHYPDEERA
ncbi:MAG: hypothetical protein ACXWZM_06885 [Solirubrobacterales bacterium]